MARIADGEVIDVTDGRFTDTSPVFTADGLYLAFLSQRSFDPVYDAHTFDLSFPFGSRPYLVPLAAGTPSPFGPMPDGRPLGQENGDDPADRAEPSPSTRMAWPNGWWPSVWRRPATGTCARSRAAWCGCAPRSPACWAKVALARTMTGRVRPCSASTCASARSRSWWARWTGSGSAATAPGSWSVTMMSCACCRPRASTTTRGDRHRRRVPGQVPGRSGRAVAACLRRGRAVLAAGTSGPRTCPGWTGTACSGSTGRCWTGSAARPTSPTCCGRCSASSARRTPT